MTFLDRALRDGHAQLTGEGAKQRITYVAVGVSDRYADPEEQVRAEFWAELIYRYEYPPERIGVEVTVPDRKPSDRADLVVFRDNKRTRPYAVIECKPEWVTDAEFNQAVEQVCGNGTWAKFRAEYVGVVAGLTRRFLDFTPKYGVLEREANIIADLPRKYDRPEEFRFYKGVPGQDIKEVEKDTLIAAINRCHQTLWGGGKLSPPAAFSELCKIIFVKLSDEKEAKEERKDGDPYQFQIRTHESSHRLAERIRALYQAEMGKNPDVFTEEIKIDDATLRNVVSHLEGINLTDTELDVKGLAFEQFVDRFFKGDFGQYFTPRELIAFILDMIPPKRKDYVLDPACGSGGFLIAALRLMQAEADRVHKRGTSAHDKYWEEFARERLYGIEINEEISRVAKMNMIIHGDGHGNVVCADALMRIERLQQLTRKDGFKQGRFDLIITNPPFGAQISASDRPYIVDYQLGHAADAKGTLKPRKTQKTEILFIERIWQFLRPGSGRAAVILPDGILTNASLQYVRDFILERFQILAIISLPQFAFAFYGAGVKASILFLRKRAEGERPNDEESVFMAAPEKIGYDATGRETENQLKAVAEQYRVFVENPTPFFV